MQIDQKPDHLQKTLSKENKQNLVSLKSTVVDNINKYSPKNEKIKLFRSLFKGREDVYAKRWTNKKGMSGYCPVCLNEWKPGICFKPKIKCSKCNQKSYSPINETVVEEHLLGYQIIGIYPMNQDEKCYFLAIDFDNDGWEEDISIIRKICIELKIPFAVERSRSGNGGHIWFFFEEEVSALLARKFGTFLLTYSMNRRYQISFKSYDRLFPNQDIMPKGGLGNLIALPLQMLARIKGNSLFVDEKFVPYEDQWQFLNDIKKISKYDLKFFITKLNNGNELGLLKNDNADIIKPWKKLTGLQQNDFPKKVEITREGMLFIKKFGISQRALNKIKRLAAFKNPEFYKNQAMRLPTYNKPRIISCSENFDDYLALPRGCEDDLSELLKQYNVQTNIIDETNAGKLIDIEFNGNLRPQQQESIEALIKQDNGVLSATTAFGKTVIGAKLISIRKVNTLILVHRKQLLSQWIERLSQFLVINEKLPEQPKKRGRKKKLNIIGQLSSGKKQLNYIVDVALMQSLNNKGEIKEYVKNYGMIIVDECHHVPAVSFEQILRKINAKYIYGLTATPFRSDGHHPIIFFYCGPIRYMVDAKKQAAKRSFTHNLIPRFTSFKTGINKDDEKFSFQELKSELLGDDIRNQLIIDDIVKSHKDGRNSLVLTGRVEHVNILSKMLKKKITDVISVTGGMGLLKTSEILDEISAKPDNKPLVLVSTGSFIGEGFDEPRLDTLFLTMPISWKGTLQQYAERLHRLYKSKKDVQIFDYVDFHIKMLGKMYEKRLKGYASIGYKVKAENIPESPSNIIFDKDNFFQIYLNDINNAHNHILIVSPFVTKKRVLQMMNHFSQILEKQVKITIITRPVEDFGERKKTVLGSIFKILEKAGVRLLLKSNIHQKFAIIDHKIIWYGSINLLSFGYSEESIMRLTSGNIANELIVSSFGKIDF